MAAKLKAGPFSRMPDTVHEVNMDVSYRRPEASFDTCHKSEGHSEHIDCHKR
jgi:hypothetical protein